MQRPGCRIVCASLGRRAAEIEFHFQCFFLSPFSSSYLFLILELLFRVPSSLQYFISTLSPQKTFRNTFSFIFSRHCCQVGLTLACSHWTLRSPAWWADPNSSRTPPSGDTLCNHRLKRREQLIKELQSVIKGKASAVWVKVQT